MKNKISPKIGVREHTFVSRSDEVIGKIRVKPNKILWRSKGKHKWRGVPINKFAEFMEQNGVEQSK